MIFRSLFQLSGINSLGTPAPSDWKQTVQKEDIIRCVPEFLKCSLHVLDKLLQRFQNSLLS